MNIAIVGSRDYQHLERVRAYVHTLPLDTVVVSGGARGVDTVAETTAKEVGLAVLVYHPEWNLLGRSAGLLRNRTIVEKAHKVVAFWNGKSKGTDHTIELAKAAGKPVTIISDEEDE